MPAILHCLKISVNPNNQLALSHQLVLLRSLFRSAMIIFVNIHYRYMGPLAPTATSTV